MKIAGRGDRSVLGQWWRSVDRWMLGAVIILAAAGLFLVSAASPSVAERLGLKPFYFVYRHIAFLVPTAAILVAMSLAGRKTLWRVSSLVLLASQALMVISIFFSPEIKGATRWVHFLGFSLQPSEFAKPAFAVAAAWLIARHCREKDFPGYPIAIGLYAVTLLLLMLQPDFGMSFVLSCILGAQIFLSGLSMIWILAMGGLGICGVVGAYLALPHVTSRIDRFLDPGSGDNYQVQKSLQAFGNGGLFGTGPAHGQVKLTLPDAHADFIFAVAGEELGLIAGLLIVALFCFVILRALSRARAGGDLFVILASGGLVTQFALQSLIHMGSSVQLLPAKGMTLPFISYGGSSMMALGFGMGMLLALTRRRAQVPGQAWKNSGGEDVYA